MNQQYMTGYRAELRAKSFLEGEGYKVIRSSGSKGEIDLVAYNKENVRFIQIKKTKNKSIPSYRSERASLSKLAIPSEIKVELWVWEGIRGWHFLPIK